MVQKLIDFLIFLFHSFSFSNAIKVKYFQFLKVLQIIIHCLEERHHWLEGTKLPFLVWTDHKNLKYIQSAKRLNS